MADDWDDGVAALNAGDFATALALLTPLAEGGHVQAQDKLSHIYWYGDGVAVDYERALYWTQQALKQNSAVAQFNMSSHYAEGRAVTEDVKQAIEWLKKAAAQKDPAAFFNLFIYAIRGVGLPRDQEVALVYLQASADLGQPVAQYTLAAAYAHGMLGLDVELDRANEYARKSADQREPDGLLLAARLAGDPSSGGTDSEASALYLRAALHDGCLAAALPLTFVMRSLTPDQLVASDAKLAAWLTAHPKPEPHSHRKASPSCLLDTGSEAPQV